MNCYVYGLMVFLAVILSLSTFTIYSDFSTTNFAFAHDGDGDGIDDDTLQPVVDEASADPFPGSGEDFTATLIAGEVLGAGSTSTGTGSVTLLWSENQERLEYEISLTGITIDPDADPASTEKVTAVHFHRGAIGASGGHALNVYGVPCSSDSASSKFSEDFPVCDDLEMEVHVDDNEIHGVWGEIDAFTVISSPEAAHSRQLSDMREELCKSEIYIQVHTDDFLAGSIRGQIIPSSELCDFYLDKSEFSATINADQVVPTTSGISGFGGTAEAHFNLDQDELFYRITLSSNVDIDGTKTPGDPSDDLIKLHIHQGVEGANGDHLLNVFGAPCIAGSPNPITDSCDDLQMEVNLVDNVISGVWDDTDRTIGDTDHKRSKKLSDHIGDLCNDRAYFQAHLTDGNIRGQIELDDHDLCDFDPNHSDFTASITNGQIIPTISTPTGASGTTDMRFSTHYDELQYDIYLEGLDTDDVQTIDDADDDLTKIHFHNAPAGTNGPIHLLNIFGGPEFSDNDYILQPGNGTIFGIWDDSDEGTAPNENGRTKKLSNSLDALCTDEVYINVHSAGFAAGEIRGQILKTPDNVLCDFDLTEHPDFSATINECKLIRASMGASHECHEDETSSEGGSHGSHHSVSETPEMDVSMWFNEERDQLYYKMELTGIDMTKEQTLDADKDPEDDLFKIHLHIGDEFSTGPHAFNILAPSDDVDTKFDNGRRTITGIWGNTDSDKVSNDPHPTKDTNLPDHLGSLCNEELYFQVHNYTSSSAAAALSPPAIDLFMRGNLEISHSNNICDTPELLSSIAVGPNKIVLIFDKPVDISTGTPFTSIEFPTGTPITISGSPSEDISPSGFGVVTITTVETLAGSTTGSISISTDLEDKIENDFVASTDTITNGLGTVPVSLSTNNPNVVLTADSTLTELVVPNGVNANLDLSSIATSPSSGKTEVVLPSTITTTVASGTSDEVQLVLPAGLTVTGNSAGFSGFIALPSKSSCADSVGDSQTVESCIEIGVSGSELELSEPAKIIFPGESFNTPFFSTFDGTKTEITSYCPSADDAGIIAFGDTVEECYFRDHPDLIIWITHFTKIITTPIDSFNSAGGGGGRGSISSLMAPNLILFNTCDENSDGIARILTTSHVSRNDIGARSHAGDFLGYGVDQTENISYNQYLNNTNTESYKYHIFDVPIPSDTDSFWINVYDLDDAGFNVSHLVDIPKNTCIGFDEAFSLQDDAEFIKPFEPLEIPDSWNIQELKIEEKHTDPNRLVFKLSDSHSNDFKTARDYLDLKESVTEPIVESVTESYQCGRGTIMVDGFCKITSDVTLYSEQENDSETLDLFEKLFKWFRIK